MNDKLSMRVLIIKTSSLGDVIHALPVLDYLHRAHPDIEIGWIVEENFKDLLDGNPLLARLHVINTKKWRRQPFSPLTRSEISSLFHELRNSGYDYVFDIQGNIKSGIISLVTGVHHRIGFSRRLVQESLNLLFTTQKAPFSDDNDHALSRLLSVVSIPFSLPYRELELSSDIAVPAEDEQAMKELLSRLKPGRKLLFHCGTTWQTKFWTTEGWGMLGAKVRTAFPDTTILLSWGNETEKDMAIEIADRIGIDALVIDRYPLKRLSALLKQVNLVVGGDTGLVHLAAAVGTRTVSFYRSSDGSKSGPRGERHTIIQSPLACTRCFKTSCSDDAACRSSITVEMMLAGVARQLELVDTM